MTRLFLSLISRNSLSLLFGQLMHIRFPRPLATWSIEVFARMYNIPLDQAEKSIQEYQSIGDFFTRRLKPGLRPLASSPVVHPADSVISQIGNIQQGDLIQAKGRSYKAQDFLFDAKLAANFVDGAFATYYLCPTDYHRVHSPIEGQVLSVIHLPGDLWPVNEWSVNSIPNLFPTNERVVLEIQTQSGKVALVFVGATNVGKISLSFEERLQTNLPERRSPQRYDYQEPIKIEKGQELGIFHMGSTVVMLYEKNFVKKHSMDIAKLAEKFKEKAVKMGEAFQ